MESLEGKTELAKYPRRQYLRVEVDLRFPNSHSSHFVAACPEAGDPSLHSIGNWMHKEVSNAHDKNDGFLVETW